MVKLSFFTWPVLALIVMLQGCAGTTLEQFDKSLELERHANSFYVRGEYLQAHVLYQELVTESPNMAEYWFRLGNCNVHLNRPSQAMEAYREAIVREPSYSKAWYNLAMLQAKAVGHTVAEMSQNVPADDPSLADVQHKMQAFLTAFNLDRPVIVDGPVSTQLNQDCPLAAPPEQVWFSCSCNADNAE
ncbi:MAG: tetratricopeptide (TPR) repeat protein [Bermanella sp.]|jgi:tetratricopeptide (TPR) repeat protein